MIEALVYLFKVFWFLLPAGFANMAPVMFRWIPFNTPIDFNLKLGKKPVLGAHKTWRGLIIGIMLAIVVAHIQFLLYPMMRSYSLIDYSAVSMPLFGFLLGFGALFGDLIKSFFKRRFNIKPGKVWIPFDQVDYILGSLLFISFYIPTDLLLWISSLLLFSLLHPIINYLGYMLRFKKNKF